MLSNTAGRLQGFLRRSRQRGSLPFLLAAVVVIMTWADPRMPQHSEVRDVLFVLDISESMNVPDAVYPKAGSRRLAHAKALVSDMMADLPCGSKTALALFAGDETVVLFEPLEVCAHYPAMEKVVSQLDTRMRWIGDSWVVRGVKQAIEAAQSRQMHLVFISDGDEMPHHEHPRIAELLPYKRKIHGLLIGVGGTTLQPVPHLNSRGEVTRYWTPEEAVIEGNYPNLLAMVKALLPGEAMDASAAAEVREHQSQLNVALMQQLASALDMPYLQAPRPQQALPWLRTATISHVTIASQDARWIPGLIACGLVLLGWFWTALPARWRR